VQDADQLPVPKLLHQTWKDKNVPEQWRNAQHSCISRHKDYTYKLWTDEDGLDLIKVRASRNLACLSGVSIQASGYFSIQLPRLYHPNEFFLIGNAERVSLVLEDVLIVPLPNSTR
jgi:hypothetical protein